MKKRTEQAAEIKVRRRGEWARVYAEAGKKDVSHLSYGPKRLRMGREAVIRMAGIGGVGTEREFRRKGLAQRVLARAMAEIEGDEYSCVGLYTSTRIVAHRLYRRFGLVDVVGSPRGYKVLDPARFICEALTGMLRDTSVGRSPMLVRVELRHHEPVFVRVEHGSGCAVAHAPGEPDVCLRMSGDTFFALWQGEITLQYAEEAKLVEWGGNGSSYRELAKALARRRAPVVGG